MLSKGLIIFKYYSKNDGDVNWSGFYICYCRQYYYQQPWVVPIDISFVQIIKKIAWLDEKLVIWDEDNWQYTITRIYSSKENKENT